MAQGLTHKLSKRSRFSYPVSPPLSCVSRGYGDVQLGGVGLEDPILPTYLAAREGGVDLARCGSVGMEVEAASKEIQTHLGERCYVKYFASAESSHLLKSNPIGTEIRH